MRPQPWIGFSAKSSGSGVAPGVASWPALIGAEMMVNGDCSSGTGWSFSAGGSIVAGKMQLVAYSDEVGNTGIDTTLLVGATYRGVFTMDTRTLGAIAWSGGLVGTSRNTTGTFSQDMVCIDTAAALTATTATMQLDNFSVKSIGLMGVEADWTFTGGNVYWYDALPSGILFDGSVAGEKAELTGPAKTSFDAAVSNDTACAVVVYSDVAAVVAGTISVTLKDGTPVNFVFDGSGTSVAHTVTSGVGSGFILTAGGDIPTGVIPRIQITLA